MSVAASLVLFASIWAIVFFMVLPYGVVSQHEDGDVVPGTPASAPSDAQIRHKALITTIAAAVVFAIVWSTIEFRLITLDDVSFLTPPSAR